MALAEQKKVICGKKFLAQQFSDKVEVLARQCNIQLSQEALQKVGKLHRFRSPARLVNVLLIDILGMPLVMRKWQQDEDLRINIALATIENILLQTSGAIVDLKCALKILGRRLRTEKKKLDAEYLHQLTESLKCNESFDLPKSPSKFEDSSKSESSPGCETTVDASPADATSKSKPAADASPPEAAESSTGVPSTPKKRKPAAKKRVGSSKPACAKRKLFADELEQPSCSKKTAVADPEPTEGSQSESSFSPVEGEESNGLQQPDLEYIWTWEPFHLKELFPNNPEVDPLADLEVENVPPSVAQDQVYTLDMYLCQSGGGP